MLKICRRTLGGLGTGVTPRGLGWGLGIGFWVGLSHAKHMSFYVKVSFRV